MPVLIQAQPSSKLRFPFTSDGPTCTRAKNKESLLFDLLMRQRTLNAQRVFVRSPDTRYLFAENAEVSPACSDHNHPSPRIIP